MGLRAPLRCEPRLTAEHDSTRLNASEYHCIKARHLGIAVVLLTVAATAVNISHHLAAPFGTVPISSVAAVRLSLSKPISAPFSCNLRTAGTLSSARLPACYPSVDARAAVLDAKILQSLRERQQHSQQLSDWLELGNSSRSVLQCTYFSIPKVIHQVWVGKAPQPKPWLDTWRWVCP
jgi:hypothetical protein